MAMDHSGHVDSTYLDMAAQILSAAKRRTYELMGNRPIDATNTMRVGGADSTSGVRATDRR